MAMIRSKQIKLNAAGDLLVGGVNGAGVVIAAGGVGTFLKVTAAGTLTYVAINATDVAYDGGTTVAAALDAASAATDALDVRLTTAEGDIDALETRATAIEGVNTTQDGLLAGLRTDVDANSTKIANIIGAVALDPATGNLVPFTGTTYVNTATSIVDSIKKIDLALSTLSGSVANDQFVSTGTGIRDLVSTTKDAAINEVFAKSVAAKRDATVNPTVADDETAGYAVGDIWINGVNAFVAIDVAEGAAVWTRIDQNLNAALFTFKGTADASGPSEGLAALEVGVETGDTFKVTVGGNFTGALPFTVNAGDFIVWTGSAWDKLDGTDTNVLPTADKIDVSGTSDTGYTITIASTYAGQASITTVGTITSGTWNGTTVGQAYGGTGLTTVTVAGDVGKVLTVGATGTLEYALPTDLYSDAGNLVATSANGTLESAEEDIAEGSNSKSYVNRFYVDGIVSDIEDEIADIIANSANQVEEDFVVAADPDADYAFTLTGTPVGDIAVFFNGLKLRKTGYSVTGTAVALIDSVVGYSAEEGDILSVSYIKAGAAI